LSQHGVRGEFGKFRRPQTDGEDTFLWDPVGVNLFEGFACGDTLIGLERTDEDTIRVEEIGDCGTFSEEFRVGEDIKCASWARVGFEDGSHGPVGERSCYAV
jgi:hypothetical protein